MLLEVSKDLGEAMKGLEISEIQPEYMLSKRRGIREVNISQSVGCIKFK